VVGDLEPSVHLGEDRVILQTEVRLHYNSCYQLTNMFHRSLCSHGVTNVKTCGYTPFFIIRVFIIFAGDSTILRVSYSYFFLTQANLEMFILQERRRANTLWH